MSILSKLKGLSGKARYEYYAEVLRRSPMNPFYYPTDWQYEDWMWMDEIDEGVLVRACGGSKTFDAVNWIVLRATLYPHEKWAWLASATGQLTQARFYFKDHPFVKNVKGGKGEEVVYLYSGAHILLRGATAGITGLRLDGIILDEEEMLQPRQIEIVYPQLHGRMTFSSVGKFFHLGTMQADAKLFMSNIEKYPLKKHPWTECPWLVKAGHIQRLIDEGNTPEHELDMLYRCIPTLPTGVFFHRLVTIEDYEFDEDLVDWGFDFGKDDEGVGVIIDGDICTIVDECTVDIETYPDAVDNLYGKRVEVEGGGYNDDIRYSAKANFLVSRINAVRVPATHKWRQDRKAVSRKFKEIRIIKSRCKKTYEDMKSTTFALDGLWLKDSRHPCHKVDAFMHAIGARFKTKIHNINNDDATTRSEQYKKMRQVRAMRI